MEDGATKLAQSGVILTYLADKTGRFKPATEPERLEALRWMLFDNHKFTGYFATYRFLKAFLKQEPDPAVMALLKSRFDGALAIVEKHLGRSRFMVGDTPTIADFSLAGYMFYPPRSPATTGPRPTPTWPPGSSACARSPAGRGPTS